MLLKDIKQLSEAKAKDIPRDHTGKPLRGLKKELALRARKEYLDDLASGRQIDIKNDMVGTAKRTKIKEEALETKSAEDLWGENSDSAQSYVSTAQYQVRPVKDTTPTKYEAFSVVGETRKPYGTFTAQELKSALKPIRPNQTPDAEGFTTYIDPLEVEAFKYSGEPVKLTLSAKQTTTLKKGDYVTRSVNGSSFEYNVEDAEDFEATLRKA